MLAFAEANEPVDLGVGDLEEQIRAFYDRADKSEADRQIETSVDWRMVVESSNDAFLCVDASGVILEWSKRAEQLFGWSREEAVGERLEETILPPNSTSSTSGGIKLLTLAGQEGKRLEITVRRRDGQEVPVEVSMSMMQREGAIFFNAFIHDITTRRHLQAQLAHSQKLESVGQLSAGIAHEINTPTQYVGDNTRFVRDALDDVFAVLEAYGELADAVRSGGDAAQAIGRVENAIEDADLDYLSTELRDSVEQSLAGVQRVASIVLAMKEFSHPGSAVKTPTDLNAAISATVTVATNEWKYVASVDTDFDETLPLVPCLPGDFNQVILNIVVNAAHAIAAAQEKRGSDEKGSITIRTRSVGNSAEVKITDTGTGIPEDTLRKIFDPFFTTKDVGVGTGQGLAISRSVIVDKHGGSLDVESTVGVGSTFTIKIPLAGSHSTGEGL